MNTHTVTAKAIDWNKVLRVTFRLMWALVVLLFKVTLIVGSAILGFFAAWFASGRSEEANDRTNRCIPNINRDASNEFAPRDHRSI